MQKPTDPSKVPSDRTAGPESSTALNMGSDVTSDAATRAQLAAEFPSMARWVYLNHAAISPWPTSVRRAVEAFAASNHADGSESFPDWVANEQGLRERYAQLIGAVQPAEISLVPNTTEGIAIVAGGLDWRGGDNIVTIEGEFPSNQMAWAGLEAQGVSLRAVNIDDCEDPEAALLNAMDERTRLLTVSAVQWISGLRLRLEVLGAACRNAGVLFFVDAIQQLGALQIDVERAQIDCLAAGGHKWQMAPEGLGLFYCRAAWRDRIAPLKLGWRMLQDPFAFTQPDRPVANGGQRFEPGTPNTLGQFAMAAALGLQERFGQSWIEARVLANTQRLMAGINDLPGLRLASRPEMERRSGIVSCLPERVSSRQLVEQLKEARIVAIARNDLLRLSPHFYQDEATTDRVLEGLEKYAK